jgi:hypothetical protein
VNRAGLKRALLGHLKDLCRLASARAKNPNQERARGGRRPAPPGTRSATAAAKTTAPASKWPPQCWSPSACCSRRRLRAANGSFGSAWPLNPFPRNGCYGATQPFVRGPAKARDPPRADHAGTRRTAVALRATRSASRAARCRSRSRGKLLHILSKDVDAPAQGLPTPTSAAGRSSCFGNAVGMQIAVALAEKCLSGQRPQLQSCESSPGMT